MAGGALVQLVAVGAQDALLTSEPEVTLFRATYRQTTNFAIENISQQINGSVRYGSRVSSIISRNGDMLADMWLELTMERDTGSGTPFFPAEEVIKKITISIGGQVIDTHYASWFRVFDNFYRNTKVEKDAYYRMTNFAANAKDGVTQRFYLPLLFWNCRSISNAIPLVALAYHELRVEIEFASTVAGVNTSTGTLGCELWCDYVFLDVEERKKLSSEPYESLIETVQFTGDENVTVSSSKQNTQSVRLSFNHPVRALFMGVANTAVHGQFTGVVPTDTANIVENAAPVASLRLLLNGTERQVERPGAYYNQVVPYQTCKANPNAGLYEYAFGTNITSLAPAGSLNFSRIDSAVLALTFKQANTSEPNVAQIAADSAVISGATNNTALRVFAVNFQWLRILSGLGGVAFAS